MSVNDRMAGLRQILVVALNPALDITHELATVDWSGVNRPAEVMTRPGGKGLNVARTLTALGADVVVTGLTGDRTGEAVRSALDGACVRSAFTGIEGETRRTFAVVDAARGRTALFNEPGPWVSAAEYARFRGQYQAEAARSAAVVLSGSLPRGLREDTYAELTAIAADAEVPVVLDTSGQALREGIAAGPAIVKPNAEELAAVAGRPLPTLEDQVKAAGELRVAGAQGVVVSLGADGLLAVTGDGVWRARQPGRLAGNPTGAGDAVVAGLALGLVLGRPWGERLRQAVALGFAAAASRVAGEFCSNAYGRAMTGASVDRLEAN